MDNNFYKLFGTAPCMALLVDREGVIREKRGWLEPEALAERVSDLLGD